MERITQLGYLGLGVSNVDEWERFATEVLGLDANGQDSDGTLFLRMDEYHYRFAVHPDGNDDLAYIGWQASDEQALESLAARLQAANVAVSKGTEREAAARRVAGLIKFADPNGIATEIFYGPLLSFDKPFNSPRSISGFVTGEQGLGHIVLGVDDQEQSLRFYRDLLGMRISDFIHMKRGAITGLSLAFLHCNPRHHSLAFGSMHGPKRLSHFMLQLKSLDDVGITYSICREQAIPIEMDLGRHTNDQMLSFYLRAPSGFAVEYGWGARVVDDSTWQVQTHHAGSIWGHGRPVEQPAQEPMMASN